MDGAHKDYCIGLAAQAHQRGAQQSVDSLMTMAKYIKPFGRILEIGTGNGATTWFLSHAHASAGVRTIDIVDKSHESNITDCSRTGDDPCNVMFQLRKDFTCGTDSYYYYDLIVIDGEHSYDSVVDDLKEFAPMVRVSGYIFIHDTEREYAARAVEDYFKDDQFVLCEEHNPVNTQGEAGWRVYQRQFAYSYITED